LTGYTLLSPSLTREQIHTSLEQDRKYSVQLSSSSNKAAHLALSETPGNRPAFYFIFPLPVRFSFFLFHQKAEFYLYTNPVR
jgi:hypothetical protein